MGSTYVKNRNITIICSLTYKINNHANKYSVWNFTCFDCKIKLNWIWNFFFSEIYASKYRMYTIKLSNYNYSVYGPVKPGHSRSYHRYHTGGGGGGGGGNISNLPSDTTLVVVGGGGTSVTYPRIPHWWGVGGDQ